MTTQILPKAPPKLNGRHEKTYQAIFRQPMAHNLEWHDVRSLLSALGDVTEGHNGVVHVARGEQTLTLHAPKHKDVATVDELKSIRHFLEQSGETKVFPAMETGTHLLVIIDHHEAKIYRTEMAGAVAQQLVPYDPHGFGRHLRSDEDTDGKRRPERKSFYEAVAATLRGADRILIFGHGTGASSAMEQLVADLKKNHGDIAKRVVGTVVVDGHQTESQLLAQARDHFAAKTT